MRCEDTKLAMMDLLHDEIDVESGRLLRTHLAHCEACRREYEELSRASLALHAWPPENPPADLVFVHPRTSWLTALKQLILPEGAPLAARLAVGFTGALVAALVTSALLNLEIRYRDGEFTWRSSLTPHRTVELTEQFKQEVTEQLRRENRELVAQLVQAHYQEQQAEFDRTLVSLATEFNRQRQQDILLLGHGLEKIEQNTAQRLRQTDRILDQLLLRVGSIPPSP
ncbi:MAG: zf-HC2 domain-containing protein [candidate division KSB1 bacterium]|nr:zf-HC2 domain-containing protein [candidate division KSB1 bacterium]MDZ7274854.1 zf-HC2 domain-containing protein [candidate division KSB1 bacterium]MDZ7288221.1 zf-HC2 domain-containing protein [candidate division KSB1 bacterium]MDZ7300398.1 zf-HC2 domain-containing protein [candidate division KSB1 bacterium]MDZ7308773.1 zf-HC2 domain-containing protein [candidate division KSB1 bacterium]